MKRTLLILTLLGVIGFQACKDDEEAPTTDDDNKTEMTFCDSIAATYTKDIKAVVDANCATSGCHEDAATAPKGIKLATYEQVKGAAGFPAFLKAIKHEAGVTAMPVGKPKLSDTTIMIIECWIDEGFKEN